MQCEHFYTILYTYFWSFSVGLSNCQCKHTITGEKFCGISSRESIFLILAADCSWLASFIIRGIFRFIARPRCWLTIVTKNWINCNKEQQRNDAAKPLIHGIMIGGGGEVYALSITSCYSYNGQLHAWTCAHYKRWLFYSNLQSIFINARRLLLMKYFRSRMFVVTELVLLCARIILPYWRSAVVSDASVSVSPPRAKGLRSHCNNI